MFCFGPDGGEVSVAPSGAAAAVATTNARPTGEPARRERNCHFHAGVEHCEDDEQGSEGKSCDSAIRDYNRPLRIGLLFVVLFGTGLAVFTPILLEKFTRIDLNGIVFIILKQFGTGVIISTAYVHLLTHAQLMFSNECLGALGYEATATAIVMAGIFLAFCFEYFGKYLDRSHAEKSASLVDSEHNVSQISESLPQSDESKQTNTTLAGLGHMHSHPGSNPDTQFNVLILEAGIVFHSILIGLTLVVAGDSFFRTLFVVVLFHQMFEGIALGTRIAALRVNLLPKMLMAGLFAIITPVGMAIGIGVLKRFNGNSPPTIVAIGTLNALSAGILVWVGLVEMWSRDWLHGDMAKASPPHVLIGITSLMLGMGIMSVLGKWA
jgi:zinc transporter 1/2/3